MLRTNRIRADTTVVPANVAYPTDSGLLAKAVRRIGTTGQTDPRRRWGARTRLRTGPERPAGGRRRSPRSCGSRAPPVGTR